MSKSHLHCSLITPEGKVFENDVDFVALPAHDGEFGILVNRAPLVCQLGAGRMKVRTGHTEETWFVDGGFAQVLDDRVTVLTQRALRPGEINREEAARQLEEARAKVATSDDAFRKRERAEASARARLHLAQ